MTHQQASGSAGRCISPCCSSVTHYGNEFQSGGPSFNLEGICQFNLAPVLPWSIRCSWRKSAKSFVLAILSPIRILGVTCSWYTNFPSLNEVLSWGQRQPWPAWGVSLSQISDRVSAHLWDAQEEFQECPKHWQRQPAPKYHTKGCSHWSVDRLGVRTL